MYKFDTGQYFEAKILTLISRLQEIGIIVTITSNGESAIHHVTISRFVVEKPSLIQRILRFGGLGSENLYKVKDIAYRTISLPDKSLDLEMLLSSTLNKYYDYELNKKWMVKYED